MFSVCVELPQNVTPDRRSRVEYIVGKQSHYLLESFVLCLSFVRLFDWAGGSSTIPVGEEALLLVPVVVCASDAGSGKVKLKDD